MNILAFDASGTTCSACVAADRKILASRYLNVGLTHSQTLLPMIHGVLRDAALDLCQIDRIALPVGPGSFTGIKIAVATAKGLAHPHQIPCCPLSSLQVLAWPFLGIQERVFAVEDARRGMFYNAVFDCKGKVPRPLTEERQISVENLFLDVGKNEHIVLCGDGTYLAEKYCQEHQISFRRQPLLPFLPAEAIVAAALYASTDNDVSSEALRPAYLRLPQAERERLEKENQKERNKAK